MNGNTSITYWMGRTQPSDLTGLTTARVMVASCPKRKCWKRSLQTCRTSIPSVLGKLLCRKENGGPNCSRDGRNFGGQGVPGHRHAGQQFGGVSVRALRRRNDRGLARMRRLNCPIPFTQWSNTHNACVSEEFVATITSKSQKCDKDSAGPSCPSTEKVRRQTTRLATAP